MATTVMEPRGSPEVRVVKRSLTLGALVFIMFFTVSGGAYGLEDVVGESGADLGDSEDVYADAWERVQED